MGETVGALSYKADLKSRARDSIAAKKDSAKETLMGTKDAIRDRIVGAGDRVGEATPDREQIKHRARRAAGIAQENPLGWPSAPSPSASSWACCCRPRAWRTRSSAPSPDDVIEKVKDTGAEAVERGKQVAQEATQSARETVQEKGREHGDELATSAQDAMRQATSGAGSSAGA